MHFEYQRIDSLPKLAWCARFSEGSRRVMVWHGPWVETRPDRFFEGTWDGSFSEGQFDDAVSFAGSGGAVKPQSVAFACPTNMCERLYSVRTGGELFISNSIVFLFEQSHDAPEPSYPHYVRDIVSIHRDGLTRSDRSWIPTRRGRRLFLHGCVNLVVSPELTITCAAKAQPIAPASYGDYVALLEGTLNRVLRNAADPARLKVYRPVVTVSKGYDSPAVAVLLARLGCSEAVTLLRTSGSQTEDDGGKAIGERLGFHVTEYERLGYLRLPGMPEAEFCTCDYGSNVPLTVMEQQLVGTVLFTGRHGDVVWSTDRGRFLPRPDGGSRAARSDRPSRRHRSVEFRKFLDAIDASVPGDFDLHLILDNDRTHKTPMIHRCPPATIPSVQDRQGHTAFTSAERSGNIGTAAPAARR